MQLHTGNGSQRWQVNKYRKFDRLLKSAARGDCVNGITRHKGEGVENPRGRSVTNLLPEDI